MFDIHIQSDELIAEIEIYEAQLAYQDWADAMLVQAIREQRAAKNV